MNLSFVETMRGTLNEKHPVDFHIRTLSTGKPGAFTVEGVVHCAPWVSEGPCEGTLTISLFPASIAYDVKFTAADGTKLELVGHKSPSIFAPIKGMTVLPIALLEAETKKELARGTMFFDILELPQFVASFLPVTSDPRRRFEARHRAVTRRALIGG
ncbi:MAG: hypothetical protein QM817_09425 [Archangium sp.]